MDNFEELAKLRDKLLNLQETFSSETGEVDYDDILKEMDIDLEELKETLRKAFTRPSEGRKRDRKKVEKNEKSEQVGKL